MYVKMVTDLTKSYNTLQLELDNAKHTLFALNDDIRRIIGRNPKDVRNDKPYDRTIPMINDSFKFKRRSSDTKSVFNRLSAPPARLKEDDSIKPRINSRVIRELPTRQEVVAAQGIDSASRARNRRMFGSLLGTLQKFCQEESRLKQKEEKKAQIEKKLEEQELQEKETLKKEREMLFMDRKRKQLEIKILETKMNRLKDFEIWESSISHLRHHIRTRTKPNIYYKPRILTAASEKLLSDSQTFLTNIIEKKRGNLNKEIYELETNTKIHESENYDNFENEDSIKNDHHKDSNRSNYQSNNFSETTKMEDTNQNLKKALHFKENQSGDFMEPSTNSSVTVVKISSKNT